ncbi:MAG: leucine-rich repeat domain-containing protein [Bacteroidaceae bacterium]|nr:leucine-rich repeat domain-containing protein [Bacteroidaceae bacterium]
MKKYYLSTIMIAAMALASCSNESDIIEGNQTTLTFTAGMSNGAATRTAIDAVNGLKLVFQKDDQILIQDGNLDFSEATATLPEGNTETSPTCSFTATFSDGTIGAYTAFYPQSAYTANAGETISAGNLKAEQTPYAGTFDPEAHIMTATSGISQTCFLFQTRNSFLKFTAPCDLDKVILRGNNGEEIAGDFTIESDGSLKAADGASSVITLSGGMTEGKVYYIALIPTVFENGLTLTLYNGDQFAQYSVDTEVITLANQVRAFNALPTELDNKSTAKNLAEYLFDHAGETVTVCVSDIAEHWEDVHEALSNSPAYVNLILPDGLETIEEGAFENIENLVGITIPGSVKSIGGFAFSNCSVSSITIPSSVKSIGEYAFQNCGGLSSITISDGLESIGEYAFSNCSVSSITIPGSVKSIGEYAFDATDLKEVNYNAEEFVYLCSTFEKVTLGNNVKKIADYAFQNCGGLSSITIPNGVESIGIFAFQNCAGLSSITIPGSVGYIGDNAFDETTCDIYVTESVYDWYKDAYGDTDPTLGRMKIY